MRDATTQTVDSGPLSDLTEPENENAILSLAWSAEEPWRIGEVAVLPEGTRQVLGRGEGEGGEMRVQFFRHRPGAVDAQAPLLGSGISRRQLALTAEEDGVAFERLGRCEVRVNGEACDSGALHYGDTLYLNKQALFVLVRRAPLISKTRYLPRSTWGAFGEPDANGILGESPVTWSLRERLAFIAQSSAHVLVTGASGTGKELAARAVHAMSSRASGPFVARNAATLPTGIIDAELFGSAKNYPNAGMPERPGLVGQAHGGILFLDEIGELPLEHQAHLLRVLDEGGEYQRLGDAGLRRSDFRLVAATNRPATALKEDMRARLTASASTSTLAERAEDIPLLARHLVLDAARRSPQTAGRFVAKTPSGYRHARISPGFIERMLRHDFTTNTRELDGLLWTAMAEAAGDIIATPRAWRLTSSAPGAVTTSAPPRADGPSDEEIRAALATAEGRVGRAAQLLGLSSRFALYRLMKKYGISER